MVQEVPQWAPGAVAWRTGWWWQLSPGWSGKDVEVMSTLFLLKTYRHIPGIALKGTREQEVS